jgi:hypothetical protein
MKERRKRTIRRRILGEDQVALEEADETVFCPDASSKRDCENQEFLED